jgi:hypothetical protein
VPVKIGVSSQSIVLGNTAYKFGYPSHLASLMEILAPEKANKVYVFFTISGRSPDLAGICDENRVMRIEL